MEYYTRIFVDSCQGRSKVAVIKEKEGFGKEAAATYSIEEAAELASAVVSTSVIASGNTPLVVGLHTLVEVLNTY